MKTQFDIYKSEQENPVQRNPDSPVSTKDSSSQTTDNTNAPKAESFFKKNKTALLIVVLAIGGFFAYKNFKK